MIKLKYNLFLIVGILLIIGCRKDDIEVSNEDTVLAITENVSFQFYITDESGQAIPNAQILINSESYLTDDNGVAITKSMNGAALGNRAEINASGYESLIKLVTAPDNSTKLEHVKLPKSITSNISTGSTGTIDGEGNLTLPASLNREDGSSYTGAVTVKSKYLDPDNENFLLSAPGNLLALNEEEEYRQLASLGMYLIELYDSNGGKLSIPDGTFATIKFPIADKHANDIASEIPLWYFDESTGLWKEEGIAKVEGGMMVAEVSHFSWWNCDLPYDFTPICLIFQDTDGNQIPGLVISFSVNNVDFGYTTTESNGAVLANIPLGVTITISYMVIGQGTGVTTIGPFNENDRKKIITLDLVLTEIFGEAIDCMSSPVTEGYAYLESVFDIPPFVLSIDGGFRYSAPKADHQLIIIDNNANKLKEVFVPNTVQNEDYDLGTIQICEEDIATKVSGYVMIDTDQDNVGDTPLPMASISIHNTLEDIVDFTLTNTEGYFEAALLPGIDYKINFISQGQYALLAAGDRTPDGDDGNESFKFGNKNVIVNVMNDEHDDSYDFLVTENGSGTISGTFMGDTDNDGIGDTPLEWATVTVLDIYGANNSTALVGSDGSYSKLTAPSYYRIFPTLPFFSIGFDFLTYADASPDPDGAFTFVTNNHRIEAVLHNNEIDADNEYVMQHSFSRTFVGRVMEDTDNDGIGDVPVEEIDIRVRNRESGLAIGGTYTNELGVAIYNVDGFVTIDKITVTIDHPDYEVINIIDTSPDNDPFIINGDVTKMEIDLAMGEWDSGNLFIVRKI